MPLDQSELNYSNNIFFYSLHEVFLGHVCFPEFTFRETTFQTFLCLFAIRKVCQRKTLYGKVFSLRLCLFSGKWFPLGCVCFPESGFRETTFQTFLCLFVIRKVGQRKTLSVKGKFGLVFRKVFSWKIWAENTFRKL